MATERVGTDCALASGAEATDESLNELPRGALFLICADRSAGTKLPGRKASSFRPLFSGL